MLAYETEAFATKAEAKTKAFSVETEAKTKTFSLEAEASARPRRLKFQPRRDRAEALVHYYHSTVKGAFYYYTNTMLLRLETALRPRRQLQDPGHIPVYLHSNYRWH